MTILDATLNELDNLKDELSRDRWKSDWTICLTNGGELIAANGPAPNPPRSTLLLFGSGLASLLAYGKRRAKRIACSNRSNSFESYAFVCPVDR